MQALGKSVWDCPNKFFEFKFQTKNIKNIIVKKRFYQEKAWWILEDIISVWLKDPWGSSFFNNLKKLSLARMFSWKFLSKPLWRSTFSFKSESCSLPYCKKTCHMLDFLYILRTTNSENHVSMTTFPWGYSYKKVLSTTGTKNSINISNLKELVQSK